MSDELAELERELAELRPTQPVDLEQRLAVAVADAELERELTALRPVSPSGNLRQELAGAQVSVAPRRRRVAAIWIAIAAAAAVLVVWTSRFREPEVAVPPKPEVAVTPLLPAAEQPQPESVALAFSDPRAQAMLDAGYRPVALEQAVFDASLVDPVSDDDEQRLRVRIRQSIHWNHQLSGARVDTNQTHEVVIQKQLAVY